MHQLLFFCTDRTVDGSEILLVINVIKVFYIPAGVQDLIPLQSVSLCARFEHLVFG